VSQGASQSYDEEISRGRDRPWDAPSWRSLRRADIIEATEPGRLTRHSVGSEDSTSASHGPGWVTMCGWHGSRSNRACRPSLRKLGPRRTARCAHPAVAVPGRAPVRSARRGEAAIAEDQSEVTPVLGELVRADVAPGEVAAGSYVYGQGGRKRRSLRPERVRAVAAEVEWAAVRRCSWRPDCSRRDKIETRGVSLLPPVGIFLIVSRQSAILGSDPWFLAT